MRSVVIILLWVIVITSALSAVWLFGAVVGWWL
jgi:hypothetical protein